MLSGVLMQVVDAFPEKRFNLARRTKYVSLFKGHPAIARIGYPPRDAEIKSVNYWAMDQLGGGTHRAYQVLAGSFGLEVPVEEKLYMHDLDHEDPLAEEFIPWKKVNIAIAPASDSPRKIMPAEHWHHLVDRLNFDGYFVFQMGRARDLHIRNAYSLLGLTTPRQAIRLLHKADIVITSDNFIMHAAKLAERPAVVLWGATLKEIYGYEDHFHITAPRACDIPVNEECIDSLKNRYGSVYGTDCPLGKDHCMALIDIQEIYALTKKIISATAC